MAERLLATENDDQATETWVPERQDRRVLVVADEPVHMLLLEGYLAQDDYDVLTAENGTEALEAVSEHEV